jgi:peroxiredoxin Q/BCP
LEAKSLRDGQEALAERGYRIVGVSPDSERSHQNFCSKHDLRFTLLADTDHAICEAFGVWVEKSIYGRKYMGVARKTFLLDEECRITHIFDKVKTAEHYQQIINELDKK